MLLIHVQTVSYIYYEYLNGDMINPNSTQSVHILHELPSHHKNDLFVVLVDIADFNVTSCDTKHDS